MDQGLTDKQAPGHLPGILLALKGILALLWGVDTDTDYVQCKGKGTIRSQQGLLPIVQSVGQSYGLCIVQAFHFVALALATD